MATLTESGWIEIGQGSFNKAYRSHDGKEVLKIQTAETVSMAALDTPMRSVRLWNELNANHPPPAYIIEKNGKCAWVCPYIEGEQASDAEMSKALIEIFNKSGRIVVDAIAPKNFLKTPSGEIVCIDIGMALQMEKRQEQHFQNRRLSTTSIAAWNELEYKYVAYFKKWGSTYPHTVDMVQALLFIKFNRPDMVDVSFLKDDPSFVKELAKAFNKQSAHSTLELLDKRASSQTQTITDAEKTNLDSNMQKRETPEEVRQCRSRLEVVQRINFPHLKNSCSKQLEQYISFYGSINRKGDFEPSLFTKIFKNEMLMKQNVQRAHLLLTKINGADCVETMQADIKNATQDLKDGSLASTLGKCLVAFELTKEKNIKSLLTRRLC